MATFIRCLGALNGITLPVGFVCICIMSNAYTATSQSKNENIDTTSIEAALTHGECLPSDAQINAGIRHSVLLCRRCDHTCLILLWGSIATHILRG